jgi:hypothetical protein
LLGALSRADDAGVRIHPAMLAAAKIARAEATADAALYFAQQRREETLARRRASLPVAEAALAAAEHEALKRR